MKEAEINALIETFTCDNVIHCQKARRTLVEMGREAVPYLLKEMGNKKHWVRWEATKALSEIGDEAATEALIIALEDREFDVRWLAAEGLINIGKPAVVPLLNALLKNPKSAWLQEGVHHVISDCRERSLQKALQPVAAAIESAGADVELPFALKKIIESLKG
jgi:HEAT repeat protein